MSANCKRVVKTSRIIMLQVDFFSAALHKTDAFFVQISEGNLICFKEISETNTIAKTVVHLLIFLKKKIS